MQRTYQNLQYMHGLGNHFETETLKDSLPVGQNNPQKCKYNLIAEQLSGTAFTLSRDKNQRSWLYKIRPSVIHTPFKDVSAHFPYIKNDFLNEKDLVITPNQSRWKPLPHPKQPTKFHEGIVTICGAGDPTLKNGCAIYLYAANTSMEDEVFYSSDGDFLIVPFEGTLHITTELGKLTVKQREIAVIPRGIKFSVEVQGVCRGYISEIFKGHFKLPDLGPIGANGLANARDFEIPIAFYENIEKPHKLFTKFQGKMFEGGLNYSPFDVVAWHGNYYPYKYNLDYYNAMGTVTFDHPDPSIFTVLTCQSDEAGTAIIDFAIFPPRWMVAEHTFRPPYYHRNIMSEYMGNISGAYDAKENGFCPGASSLHNIMQAHGPDSEAYSKATNQELCPVRYPYENLAFMFESSLCYRITKFVMDDVVQVDHNYWQCWKKLEENELKQD